jgi:hypothetical protein
MPAGLLQLDYDIPRLLLPGEPKKMSDGKDSEWNSSLPLFSCIIDIRSRDVGYLWLVHLDTVHEARNVYHARYETAHEKQKRQLDVAVREFVGSWEGFDKVEWALVKWSAGGAASMSACSSFRHHLEELVEGSSEVK